MKLTRTRLGSVAAAAAVLAGGGALTAQAAGAAAAPSAPAAQAAQPKTVVVTCAGAAKVRPARDVLACGDADDVLTGLHWKSWGPNAAFAVGVERIDDCTPNCASGRFHAYPVLVNLWRPEHAAGRRVFTRATMVYTAARPAHVAAKGKTVHPATATLPLPTHRI